MSTDEERAISAAERIRKDIERDCVNYRNKTQVAVTVTMGIAPYRKGMTIQKMMDEADSRLYWGKHHGKNRIVSKIPEEE